MVCNLSSYRDTALSFTLGGVVTFYPSAFIDDYFGTIKLIRKLHEHPLWMAFISPTCLGYLANHAYKGRDPLSLYARFFAPYIMRKTFADLMLSEGFIYQNLLRLIADGEISLMAAPPLPTAAAETIKSWVRNQCRTTSLLDALSIGTAAFNSICANKDQNEWIGAVQHAANCDIVTIQQQPAILYKYRRFVVVKSERDQSKPPNSVGIFSEYSAGILTDSRRLKHLHLPASTFRMTISNENPKSSSSPLTIYVHTHFFGLCIIAMAIYYNNPASRMVVFNKSSSSFAFEVATCRRDHQLLYAD